MPTPESRELYMETIRLEQEAKGFHIDWDKWDRIDPEDQKMIVNTLTDTYIGIQYCLENWKVRPDLVRQMLETTRRRFQGVYDYHKFVNPKK